MPLSFIFISMVQGGVQNQGRIFDKLCKVLASIKFVKLIEFANTSFLCFAVSQAKLSKIREIKIFELTGSYRYYILTEMCWESANFSLLKVLCFDCKSTSTVCTNFPKAVQQLDQCLKQLNSSLVSIHYKCMHFAAKQKRGSIFVLKHHSFPRPHFSSSWKKIRCEAQCVLNNGLQSRLGSFHPPRL